MWTIKISWRKHKDKRHFFFHLGTISNLMEDLGEEVKQSVTGVTWKTSPFVFPAIKLKVSAAMHWQSSSPVFFTPPHCCSLKGKSLLRTSEGGMTQNCKWIVWCTAEDVQKRSESSEAPFCYYSVACLIVLSTNSAAHPRYLMQDYLFSS